MCMYICIRMCGCPWLNLLTIILRVASSLCVCVCVRVNIDIHTYICMNGYVGGFWTVPAYVYLSCQVCMYLCVCVCIYIFTHVCSDVFFGVFWPVPAYKYVALGLKVVFSCVCAFVYLQ